MPSGSAGGTVKEWKYERVMSFLLPYMQPRSSRNTLQIEENEPVDMSVAEVDVDPDLGRPYSPLTLIQRPVTPCQSSEDPTQQSGSSTPPTIVSRGPTPIPPPIHPRVQELITEGQQHRQKRKRTNQQSSTEQQLLDIITQPTTTPSPHIPRQEDEMYYFALSLVPKLNRLLPRNRTRAQMHILGYLADLELEDENQRQQATQAHTLFQGTASHPPQGAAFQPYHPTPTYQEQQTHHPHHATQHPTTSSTPEHSASYYQQL
nr:uncharacterized protein LOC129418986 [Misgurnus anguillicaudatus]